MTENKHPYIKYLLDDIRWPDNKKFAVGLSHDIDIVVHDPPRMAHGWRNYLDDIRRKRTWVDHKNLVLLSANRYLFNPYSNIVCWMDIEKQFGVRSSFYILSKHLVHKNIRDSLLQAHKSGWEVGLHADFHTCNNRSNFQRELNEMKKALNIDIKGNRHHFLELEIPLSWNNMKDSGLMYDTTFGINEEMCHPHGVEFPFIPYLENCINDDFVVVPMNIMDGHIFLAREGFVYDVWLEKVKRFMENAQNLGTSVVLNWHNRVFDEQGFPYWKAFYVDILKVLKKDFNCWVAPIRDIAGHCLEHARQRKAR